jgi:hypothetical protein
MRIIGTFGSTETRRIEVEADSYDKGRRLVEAQVPEDGQLLSWRTDRDAKSGRGGLEECPTPEMRRRRACSQSITARFPDVDQQAVAPRLCGAGARTP